MRRNYKAVKDDFVRIARMTQPDLKEWVTNWLTVQGYAPIVGDGYVYARGGVVLLTAHMDTVHAQPVKKVLTQTYPDDIVISSPQGIGGDDRCGVWCIFDIVPRLLSCGIRPAVLFCEDEEIGGIGSGKFCKTEYIKELSELKYLIEIDRAGRNDAVFYDDGNEDFHKYVEHVTKYKTAQGSFSDISHLCPACGRSGVNLSSGYYNPHTLQEYVVTSEMVRTADTVVKMVKDSVSEDVPQFEYIDVWEDDGFGAASFGAFSGYDYIAGVEFTIQEDGKQQFAWYDALSFYDAVGQLMTDHPNITWNDVIDYDVY